MSNMKKYLLTAVVLGSIAMASGLLIGATNLVTSGPIAAYEKNQINNGIKAIFSDCENLYYSNDEDIEINKENPYVNHIYHIYDGTNENDNDNAFVGWALKTEGSNSYGKIALIIGFDGSGNYESISVIKNEQSFASTLNKKYINKVKVKEREIDDVSCGATYGAKLVRDMIKNAQSIVDAMFIKD